RPQLPQWACFDTAFHGTLPEAAYSYAIPLALRNRGYRRFGFHGLNHQHVARQAAGPRLISVHLGAGCSLAAIADGRCLDTTMGFTPMEGLVMATRSGSIDPGLLLALLKDGIAAAELEEQLNHHSGLAGLSGLSGDWQELRGAAERGHSGAQLALAVFLHRLKAGIAAMAASLGGVDQIALSGGIGANDTALARQLQTELAWLGKPQWLQIPADEEGMIARLISDPEDRGFDAANG
ncbi:MAG: acetate kinase, partial [Vulcanococcus sp.]